MYYRALHRVRRWVVIYQSSTPSRQSVDLARGLVSSSQNITIFVAHPLFSAVLLAAAAISSSMFLSAFKTLNVSVRGCNEPYCPTVSTPQSSRAPSIVASVSLASLPLSHSLYYIATDSSWFCLLLAFCSVVTEFRWCLALLIA